MPGEYRFHRVECKRNRSLVEFCLIGKHLQQKSVSYVIEKFTLNFEGDHQTVRLPKGMHLPTATVFVRLLKGDKLTNT